MTAVPGMVFSIPGSWKMLARKDAHVVLYILRTLYIITLYGVRVRRQYECMECSPKPWLTPLTGGPYCMRTTRGPKSDSLEKTAIINPHAMRFIVILAGGWIRSASSTSRPVEPKICALTPPPKRPPVLITWNSNATRRPGYDSWTDSRSEVFGAALQIMWA